jgi:hypothetical protein
MGGVHEFITPGVVVFVCVVVVGSVFVSSVCMFRLWGAQREYESEFP